MSIVISLIINWLIVYAWIWVINLVFKEKKLKIKITIKVFLIWFFLVFWLFFYKYFLNFIWHPDLYFLQEQTIKSVSIFIFFCDIIFLILTLIFKNLAKKNIISIFVIINLLFFGIYLAWFEIGVSLSIMYYLISSYAEESLKYGASNNVFLWESSKKRFSESDLIFFCMMIALWFGVVENVFYVWYSLYSWEKINILTTIVSRGLVSILIHIISTGIIWFVYIKLKNKINVFVSIVLWLMAGITIHWIYNLSLHFKLWYVVIWLVLVWYFVISYLIYNSDLIYNEEWKIKN